MPTHRPVFMLAHQQTNPHASGLACEPAGQPTHEPTCAPTRRPTCSLARRFKKD
ncbi:unnamed protein product, partial [Dovyalis caffra]